MYQWARLGAGLALTALLAGCSSERHSVQGGSASENASAKPAITVTTSDFAFQGPDSVAAGEVTVHLVNVGKELHQVQLIKLEQNKTLKDVGQALKAGGPPPSWIKFVGGPNGVAPGQETQATSVLTPGRYAYICLIPSPDGVIHAAKGMARPFEVTAASSASSPAPPPAADVTIKLVDYDFQSSRPLRAGRQRILVENAGVQPHELVLLRLAPGKKVEDFANWAEHGMQGPPPAEPLGGVTLLDNGGKGSFTADLTPGDYGLICFFPDAKDGKPHLAHGMMKAIKVS